MREFQKNFALACLCMLAVVFFADEFITHFFFQQPVDSLVSQNRVAIKSIYAGKRPDPTVKNLYFELALPSGMELFALDNNNCKLRYQRFYFEVHTFTSKINSVEYSKAKFPVERMYHLDNFKDQAVFFYVKQFSEDTSQIALYTNSLEITATVPNAALEAALLKSVEVMRNINPLENSGTGVIIGGDDGLLPNQGRPGLGDENEEEEESDTDMPLVRP